MEESTVWWLATGALVVAELLTGTFYLLMVAVGFAAGALAAHLGLSTPLQIVTAAVVGAGLVVGLHQKKQPRPGDPSPRADRSVNLDVGETVLIEGWNADGTTTVKYRGATWTEEPIPPVAGVRAVAVNSRCAVYALASDAILRGR